MIAEDPLLGRQLANYRVERLLGRGGMALVYYGWDVKLERPVAIKVIDARYRSNRAYAERFVREARAVATWRHENIIQVYYADEQDDLYYFAMEYIAGLDLATLLAQYADAGELMPHDDVLRIGRAIAGALDYAHERGLVHRDVKPANVLVAGDRRVVLTDFGLALDVGQGSLGEVFGSAHYTAPEQARRSADAVPRSDQYALGVVLYEMLTGVVPFDDPSPTSVAMQHLISPPPPPCQVNPLLNVETGAVLLQALAKAPEQRYETCGELLDELERALAGGVGPAPEEGEGPAVIEEASAAAARRLSSVSVDERVAAHLEAGVQPPDAATTPQAEPVVFPETDTLLGRQLDEYRLEALLGQGGMARIYRGQDVRLKRYAAIKVIAAPLRANAGYIRRFRREAQAIAQLEHPHIVRLYRYGEAAGLLYIAMEYVEGQDLRAVLRACRERQETMPLEQAARIVREVCLALDAAHSRGVIHRDVKPSNIMLDQQGRAILADFGLALLAEAGTSGEVFGSPHYIAPEQAVSSAGATPQSDLYAVGVILYEMLTGLVPFDAEDPLAIAVKHVHEPPPRPRELRPELSPEVEAVVLKALAKDPAARYPDGAALAEALDQALGAAALPRPEEIAVTARRPLPPIPAAVAAPASQPPAAEQAAPAPAAAWRRRWLLPVIIAAGVVGVALIVVLSLLWGGVFPGQRPSPSATAVPTTAEAATVGPSTVPVVVPTTATAPPTPTPGGTSTPPSATPSRSPAPPTAVPPTPGPTPIPLPVVYDLRILRRGEDGLFLVNRNTPAFPLLLLRLGDGEGEVHGTEWRVPRLEEGACVVVWKDRGGLPKDPPCTQVGEILTRPREGRFWTVDFAVYYRGQFVVTCEQDRAECSIRISELAAPATFYFFPFVNR